VNCTVSRCILTQTGLSRIIHIAIVLCIIIAHAEFVNIIPTVTVDVMATMYISVKTEHTRDSGGLPIRQSRQLPKARHGAEARNFSVKMLDEKLNHLSIMSRPIESGLLRKLDFSAIISEFMKRKARKMFY